MPELRKDTLCKYCLGCNKLSDYNFIGTRNCKGFVPGYKDWRERYEKALKQKLEESRQTNKLK